MVRLITQALFVVVSLALGQTENENWSRGFYLSIDQMIANTPVRGSDSVVVVLDGTDSETGSPFYHLARISGGESKKIRGESFVGFCDGTDLYLVDNQNIFSGKQLRKVHVGSKFIWYLGTDIQAGKPSPTAGITGGSSGRGVTVGIGVDMSTSPVPVLQIYDRTGKSTTISSNSWGIRRTVKRLLTPWPLLLEEYSKNPTRDLKEISTYLNRINTL